MNEYKPTPALSMPIKWVYCIYAYVSFVVLLLIIFPIVLIGSTLGRVRGGNIVNTLCRIWAIIWLPMVGIFHRNIYKAAITKGKQYVFVANHISYMDIPVIFMALRKKRFRILAKMELSKIPIFGFLYRNSTVMVDRSDAKKRAKSIGELKAFMQKDISIYIYPEGTFNETGGPLKSFYDGAFRLAIETQTAIKPIVFLDTAKILHYKSVLSLTPGQSRAVILEDIEVAGLEMKDLPALKLKTYKAMEACLLEYNQS